MGELQDLFIWSVPVIGIIGIVFALFLARDVLARDTGTPEMQKIGLAIFEGANAFLRRQYQTIGLFAIVGAVVLGALITAFEDPGRGIRTAIAFIVGAFLSGLSGYIGMSIAVQANQRTASAAARSLGEALTVALRGGAVSGFLVVSLSLLGVFGHLLRLRRRRSEPGRGTLPDHRLRLRRLVRGPFRPVGRWYLHQGGRCRRGPRR